MANPNPSIGRGGRGAALAQLLSQQVRRPGDAPQSQQQPTTAFGAPQQFPGVAGASQPAAFSQTQPVAHSVTAFGDGRTSAQSVAHTPSTEPQSVGQLQQPPVSAFGDGRTSVQSVAHTPSTEPQPVGQIQQPSSLLGTSSAAPFKPPTGRGTMLQRFLEQRSSGSGTPASSVPQTPLPSESESSGGPTRSVGRAAIMKPASVEPSLSALSGPSPLESASMLDLKQALPTPSPQLSSDVGGSGDGKTSRGSYLERFIDKLNTDSPAVVRIGKAGRPLSLKCNYIAMKCRNAGVYQYAVSFTPEVDSVGMRFRLLDDPAVKSVLGEVKAFDGRILFLPIQLPQQETSFIVNQPTDQKPVQIIIKMTKVLPAESCLQLYNITFRSALSKLKMCRVGRDYYMPEGAVPVPQHKLEVWPGYITAIDRYEGGLLMITDVKHRVLRTQTVLDVMYDIIRTNQRGFKEDIAKRLIGCTVLTRYNNQTYRIDDIAWDKTPELTFPSADGTNISFIEYYKRNYNKEIRDLQQPLLIHVPKQKDLRMRGRSKMKKPLSMICLIPELSYMTGLTDDMRQDFKVMKDIATHTRVPPAARRASMCKLAANLNQNPAARAELDKWGLQIDTDVMSVEGRILDPEKIQLKNKEVSAGETADWSRELGRAEVLSAVDLNHWLLVSTQRDAPATQEFAQQYIRCARDMGIKIEPPIMVRLQNDRTETYLHEIKSHLNQQIQLVVTVFPTSRDDRYNAIKKLCCVEMPVPSQCINSRTIGQQQKLRSVTQKIALQINCKLGGELWGLKMPTKGLMVCGIDTYHEGRAGKANSVGGFVCSINESCTRWYSRVCIQMPGEEMINGLKPCFVAALRKYYEVNHVMPKWIFLFRDGVGDGQLHYVKTFEVPQLTECFKSFGEDYNPKMAAIIVQKRINQRLFASNRGQLDNPGPGSIVDHTITRRQWCDFFLVSQYVRQGTVSPTHYVVVYDTTNLDIDKIQALSYKMTHMYFNWPGTVRVPAPCQYAHKLAYLVGENIRKEPSDLLADRLFFL